MHLEDMGGLGSGQGIPAPVLFKAACAFQTVISRHLARYSSVEVKLAYSDRIWILRSQNIFRTLSQVQETHSPLSWTAFKCTPTGSAVISEPP